MTTERVPASQYPNGRSALGTVGTLGLLAVLCAAASLLLAAVYWGAGWAMTAAGL